LATRTDPKPGEGVTYSFDSLMMIKAGGEERRDEETKMSYDKKISCSIDTNEHEWKNPP
jgi:hypothetical protein